MRSLKLTAMTALFFGSQVALSAPIFYEVDNIAGDTWQYSYTVGNETAAPIDWFTLFFDPDLYTFDTVTDPDGFEEVDPGIFAGPAGWDVIVLPPDFFFPGSADNSPGLFDACGFEDDFLPCFGDAVVNPGDLVAGFSIIFDWLGGPGTAPGSQPFTLFGEDLPNNPQLFTQQLPSNQVPLPGTLPLLLAGLLMLGAARRRRFSG